MAVTLEEVERLTLLIEECAEVTQRATKIIRYGYQSKHPTGDYDNKELLEQELGDLVGIIDLMATNGDISTDAVKVHRGAKLARLPKWLQLKHLMP
jgi:NTP pyrophosphatase (non-canonical NTP hydrolase)